jgi:hypothetical protein
MDEFPPVNAVSPHANHSVPLSIEDDHRGSWRWFSTIMPQTSREIREKGSIFWRFPGFLPF